MKVPGPGIESEPQLPPILKLLVQHKLVGLKWCLPFLLRHRDNAGFFNPLYWAEDWNYVSTVTWATAVGFLIHCTIAGTPGFTYFYGWVIFHHIYVYMCVCITFSLSIHSSMDTDLFDVLVIVNNTAMNKNVISLWDSDLFWIYNQKLNYWIIW